MKKLLCLLCVSMSFLLITSCRGDGRMEYFETRHQMNYFVIFWRFESHLVWDTTMWLDVNNTRNRQIIFVSSAEAAAEYGLPLDRIIAWPSPYTLGKLNELNDMDFNFDRMLENSVCLDELNISLPITAEDLVSNWENIDILLGNGLTTEERAVLNNHARINYQTATFDYQTLRALLFPGRLDAINEMITGRDINSGGIERINHSRGTDFTIDNLPFPPFTEDDVRENPRLIATIIRQFLIGNEWRSLEPEAILRRQLE